MELIPQLKVQRYLLQWAGYLLIAVLFISLLTFSGWLLHIEVLKHPTVGLVAMNHSTVICFFAAVGHCYCLPVLKKAQKSYSVHYLQHLYCWLVF